MRQSGSGALRFPQLLAQTAYLQMAAVTSGAEAETQIYESATIRQLGIQSSVTSFSAVSFALRGRDPRRG